jgi:hypothetical protein
MSAVTECLTDLDYVELTLWVLADNVRARRFYAAVGFRPDGVAKVDDRRGFLSFATNAHSPSGASTRNHSMGRPSLTDARWSPRWPP